MCCICPAHPNHQHPTTAPSALQLLLRKLLTPTLMLCLSTRICHHPQGGSRSCQGGCPAPCGGRGGEEPGCSAAMSELMPPAAPGRRSPEPPPPCRLVGDRGGCTTHGLAVVKHPQATHGEAPWEPAAAIARTAALDSCAGKPLPWGTPTFYPTGSILVRATQDLEVSPPAAPLLTAC